MRIADAVATQAQDCEHPEVAPDASLRAVR